jgi:hypothetical protein
MLQEELIAEASHVITSLWNPSHTRDVAENGIITHLESGEVAIVSAIDGKVMWCGGSYLQMPWAVAFWTAARRVTGSSLQ